MIAQNLMPHFLEDTELSLKIKINEEFDSFSDQKQLMVELNQSNQDIVTQHCNTLISDGNLILSSQRNIKQYKMSIIDPETVTPLTVPLDNSIKDILEIEDRDAPISSLKMNKQTIKSKTIRKTHKKDRNIVIQVNSKGSLESTNDCCQEEKNNSGEQNIVLSTNTIRRDPKEVHQQSPIMNSNHLMQKQDLKKSNNQNQKLYYIDNLKVYILNQEKNPFMAQMYLHHFIQTYQILAEFRQLRAPDHYDVLQKISPQLKKQKTLVIDLDETLIHCNEFKVLKSDFSIQVKVDNENSMEVSISIRPYAEQFLKNMAEHFEIIIFTASNGDYANQVIDYLDPLKKYVKHRLFREDCINLSFGSYIKDLRILNKDLSQVVLVDNSAYSFLYQVNNGVPIIPYLDNKSDDELLQLEAFLTEMIRVDDVRVIIEQRLQLAKFQYYNSIQEILNLLI